jgi:hypothetical protein
VDNVFCSEELLDAIIKCKMDDTACPVRTDHYLIITQVDIYAPKATWAARRNFRLADWPELVKTLKSDLANLPPPTEIENIQTFTDRLNETMQKAIEKHVKLTKPSPYSKRWWSTELANEKKKMQQLGGRVKYHRLDTQHPVHEEYH